MPESAIFCSLCAPSSLLWLFFAPGFQEELMMLCVRHLPTDPFLTFNLDYSLRYCSLYFFVRLTIWLPLRWKYPSLVPSLTQIALKPFKSLIVKIKLWIRRRRQVAVLLKSDTGSLEAKVQGLSFIEWENISRSFIFWRAFFLLTAVSGNWAKR